MVPVQKAQYRYSGTDDKVMPAAKKFFLAGIFFVIGVFAALVQLHPLNPSAETPDSKEKSGITVVPSPFLPVHSAKTGNSDKKIPHFPDVNAPYYDKGSGKYIQAYPQPILLVDAKAVPAVKDAESKNIAAKTIEDAKKTAQVKPSEQAANQVKKPEAVKPVQITQAEFKPLHQFNTLPKDKPAETVKSESKETPKPVAKGNDNLLPVFDFAENLAPSKTKKEAELPVNPFPSIPAAAAAKPATIFAAEKQPVPPMAQPFLFQKLIPLVPPDEKEEVRKNKPVPETNAEVKPNETPLLRMSPLAELMLQGIHSIYR